MEKRVCDRCGQIAIGTIMSWFTTETICGNCSEKERQIREILPNKGFEFEGCGFVPDIPKQVDADGRPKGWSL
jgi:hypothetical protein